MHAIFIPYGERNSVNKFLDELSFQRFRHKISSPDKKYVEHVWSYLAVRKLPFGIMEIIFPKELKDVILSTLDFANPSYPQHKWINKYLGFLRKILKIKKAGKFDCSKKMLLSREGVSLIPLGIREDSDITIQEKGKYFGWTYEGL